MREKIAEIVYKDIMGKPEHMIDQILSLFKEQIEKMGVLSDEEIFEVYATAGQLTTYAQAVAQAQLAKCKRDALRGCE